MYMELGNKTIALKKAGESLGFSWLPGGRVSVDGLLPPEVPSFLFSLGKEQIIGCAWRLRDQSSEAELGVYFWSRRLYVVWRPSERLEAMIGPGGERLKTLFYTCAFREVARQMGLPAPELRVSSDGTLTCALEQESDGMRKKVILTVYPNGETKVEVQGSPGAQCQDVTKRLESGLGVVVSDVATEEMNSPAEIHQSVGQQE
jgi:hypothetical protein